MEQQKNNLLAFAALLFVLPLFLGSCQSPSSSASSEKGTVSSDTAAIERGKAAFVKNCSACHNFRHDGIGPQLGGILADTSADWVRNFINDPKKMIDGGDPRAQQLYKKYKTAMPTFGFADKEVNDLLAYLSTRSKPAAPSKVYDDPSPKPIIDTIALSGLTVDLKFVTQFPSSSENGKKPLARITKMDVEPQSGEAFVLDLRGKLYKMKGDKPVEYMDMAKLKPGFINQPGLGTGFGSFAFHPDFKKNGLLYTTHTEAAGSAKADFRYDDSIEVTLQWVLTEWKADHPGDAVFSGTGRELMRVNMVTGMHGMQDLEFNPLAKPGGKDYGMLYLGIGDGGCVDEGYPEIAHHKNKVWGTVLRIDPAGRNSGNGQYGIPADNPFAGEKGGSALGEIFALGFRNPHRISWMNTGEMLVCNIGGGSIESVNEVEPGRDYGWPIREGTFVLDPHGNLNIVSPLPSDDSTYKITYPVAEYDHHGGGSAISGGYEYTGASIPALKGKFLFGDIPSGRLFFINAADIKQGRQTPIREYRVSLNGVQTTLRKLCGNDRVEVRYGKDSKGTLYLMTKADGKLYKVVGAHDAK